MNSDANSIKNILHKDVGFKICIHYLNRGIQVPATETVALYHKLLEILHSSEYRSNRIGGPISFCVDIEGAFPVESTQTSLTKEKVKAKLEMRDSADNCLLINNYGFFLEKIDNIRIDNQLDALKVSNEKSLLIYFCSDLELHVLGHGEYIDFIASVDNTKRAKVIDGRSNTIQRYEELLNEHYSDQIYKQRGVKIFKNKKDMILYPSPEDIFRRNLASFLRNNVTDGNVLQEPLNNEASDRNDIRVVQYHTQNVYIFEIKWLGKSESSKNRFVEQKFSSCLSGIEQVNIYLREDSKAVCGVLIVYDGRKDDNDCSIPESTDFHFCQREPMFYSLKFPSASTVSKSSINNKSS